MWTAMTVKFLESLNPHRYGRCLSLRWWKFQKINGNWGVSMRWHAVTPGKGSGLLWDVLSTYCSLFWPLTGLTGVTEASGTRLSLFVFSCEFSALPRSWPMSKLLQFFVGVTFTEADWLTPSVVRPVSVDAVPAAERTGRIITTWLVLTWWSECDWLHPSQAGIQVSLFECNFFFKKTTPFFGRIPFCHAIYLVICFMICWEMPSVYMKGMLTKS